MVHRLVDPATVGDEPVVDAPERGEHAAANTRLLGDLPDGGLLGRLTHLDVPLGQRPQHASAPVNAPDQRGDLLVAGAVEAVDHQPAGGCLVHRAQPLRYAARRARRTRVGRCCFAGRLAVSGVLGRSGSTTTPAPSSASTWFSLFAVRHPSDSSWQGSAFPRYSPLVGCARARRAYGRAGPTRLVERA